MKKLLNNNRWWSYLILTFLINWPIWGLDKVILTDNRMSLPYSDTSAVSNSTAIMTYVSSSEQERLVWAMIKSVREFGVSYRNSKIFIVLADQINQPCNSLKGENIELLPLRMDSAFTDYPLAVKAFAAAQVEKRVGEDVRTLIWLDPGILVLNSVETLDLQDNYDFALRPVTLRNDIGIPPGTEPDGYWKPIYKTNRLNHKRLQSVRTIVEEEEIQPYYNCEVYSVNPKLGICREWAIQLSGLLRNEIYQKTYCTTFLRQLFLHQAVLSAVVTSKVQKNRMKQIPLTSSYPFNQHGKLQSDIKITWLNELKIIIFDYAWANVPSWENMILSHEPLKSWLRETYIEYLYMDK